MRTNLIVLLVLLGWLLGVACTATPPPPQPVPTAEPTLAPQPTTAPDLPTKAAPKMQPKHKHGGTPGQPEILPKTGGDLMQTVEYVGMIAVGVILIVIGWMIARKIRVRITWMHLILLMIAVAMCLVTALSVFGIDKWR